MRLKRGWRQYLGTPVGTLEGLTTGNLIQDGQYQALMYSGREWPAAMF